MAGILSLSLCFLVTDLFLSFLLFLFFRNAVRTCYRWPFKPLLILLEFNLNHSLFDRLLHWSGDYSLFLELVWTLFFVFLTILIIGKQSFSDGIFV